MEGGTLVIGTKASSMARASSLLQRESRNMGYGSTAKESVGMTTDPDITN